MEKTNETLIKLEEAIKQNDKEQAMKILNEIKNNLTTILDNKEVQQIKEKLEEILEETKKEAKKHPLFAIAVAGIIGFLLGRLSK